MGAHVSIVAIRVVVGACAGVQMVWLSWGLPGCGGSPLPWVMSMASVGSGEGGGAPLQSVVGTDCQL